MALATNPQLGLEQRLLLGYQRSMPISSRPYQRAFARPLEPFCFLASLRDSVASFCSLVRKCLGVSIFSPLDSQPEVNTDLACRNGFRSYRIIAKQRHEIPACTVFGHRNGSLTD